MLDGFYGRGQVEWALWKAFSHTSFAAPTEMPKMFRTRIKRLLEIDRTLDLSDAEAPPEADYAFAPPANESGEAAYRPVDGFCLAVALDLLNAGFKQTEVVFLMRYLRAGLEAQFAGMLAGPSMIDRQRHRAGDYPNLPAYDEGGRRYADGRTFVILQTVEMTETIPRLARQKHPVILEPIFCAGIDGLSASLHDLMPNRSRIAAVVEIASTAQAIVAFLKDAPVIRRGRPGKANPKQQQA